MHTKLIPSSQILGVCIIITEMFGNDARIIGILTIMECQMIGVYRLKIPGSHGFSVAAVSTSMLTPALC